jgi:exodeoxyribonuclease V alpha subunit
MTQSTAMPSGELTAIDRVFARFIARGVSAEYAAVLHHTALLVSAERAQGNSCVDLAAHAELASPDVTAHLRFPPLDDWRAALLASARCAVADDAAAEEDGYDLAPLVLDGSRLYLRRFYAAERRLARAIRARIQAETASAASLDASAPLFRRLFPMAAMAVDWQAVAAVAALRSPLVFVTGGPGTGKTTVAARLLAMLLDREAALDIAVAAPTGRAAARLTEAIGAAVQRERLEQVVAQQLPAAGSTLHRLLGYTPWNEQFHFHRGNPLPHDVVIVDEASMVDVLMMDALFAALRPNARLIVLGDPDQLASVDTGFVLGDIARAAGAAAGEQPEQHSYALANDYARLSGGSAALLEPQATTQPLRDMVVQLRVSYRFGARPGIGQLAAATQEGNAHAALAVLADETYGEVALDPWPAPGDRGVDTAWADQLLAPLLPEIEAYLQANDAASGLAALARFRVLCALREGDTGVTGLNAQIERWLKGRGHRVDGWYDHRPVLITANDAGMRLFNGDVGMTMAIDGVPMVHFPLPAGGVRALPPSRLPAHETAWAMTVHKAQGSEFDHVRFVLPASDSRILTRELLYTGITRAKERVTIVGSPDIVRLATGRSVVRASGLIDRLAERGTCVAQLRAP